MRPINTKQRHDRAVYLIELIEQYPEAIDLNVTKLIKLANIPQRVEPIIRRTWQEIRKNVKFKREQAEAH